MGDVPGFGGYMSQVLRIRGLPVEAISLPYHEAFEDFSGFVDSFGDLHQAHHDIEPYWSKAHSSLTGGATTKVFEDRQQVYSERTASSTYSIMVVESSIQA